MYWDDSNLHLLPEGHQRLPQGRCGSDCKAYRCGMFSDENDTVTSVSTHNNQSTCLWCSEAVGLCVMRQFALFASGTRHRYCNCLLKRLVVTSFQCLRSCHPEFDLASLPALMACGLQSSSPTCETPEFEIGANTLALQ